ncbi:MAG: hypothetical protein EOO04_02255 [Chitinophagaceae bacterium]|nr:MAG: hypothetical protein EOO04_02255 [Chitinophagaceae bacterium]
MHIHFRAPLAYAGCGVRVDTLPPAGTSCPVSVTFDDESLATGQCSVINDQEIKVWVDAYTTQAGNIVKARAWLIQRLEGAKIWKAMDRIGADGA